jgi:hypothetical protein
VRREQRTPRDNRGVIWFFERSGEKMRVTTRFDNATREYVVEIESADRGNELERYTDFGAFDKRVQALHVELLESQWTQAGPPGIIADGWRGPTSRN